MHSIPIENQNLKDVNPRECGEEVCPPDFWRGPTSRQYYLLHYVFSGSGILTTGDREYPVSKGQIFVIHPYEIVRYSVIPQDPWHYCWVGFDLSFPLPALDDNSVLDLPQAEHIFRTLRSVDQAGLKKELLICGKIYELLSLLWNPAPTAKSKGEEYAKLAQEYIDANYFDPITVAQVAQVLHINRSYLSTVFHKFTGKSPQQYLMDIRLENAAELISNYGYSIGEAAVSSGYADIFNFSKMFKRKFGVPPTHYIKNSPRRKTKP